MIITTLHVVVGELAPKSAAIARTPPIVLALTPIMRMFYVATKPLVEALNWLGNLVLRPFGIPPASESGSQPHSEDEGPVAEAEQLAAELSSSEQPLGSPGPRFDRRSPFYIGLMASAGVAVTYAAVRVLASMSAIGASDWICHIFLP